MNRNRVLDPYPVKITEVFPRNPIRSDQSLSHVRLFATPWIAARQASLSITNSRSSLKLTSIESVMPFSHLILCRPLLLLPPIPPASESFPMSQGIEPQNLRGLLLQDSPVFFLESNTYWKVEDRKQIPDSLQMAYFCLRVSGLTFVTSTPPTWTRKEKNRQMERQRVSRRISLIYFTKKTNQIFTNWNKYGSLKLNGKSITWAVKLLDWKIQFLR